MILSVVGSTRTGYSAIHPCKSILLPFLCRQLLWLDTMLYEDIPLPLFVSTDAVVCKGTGQEWSDGGRECHAFTLTTNSRSVVP